MTRADQLRRLALAWNEAWNSRDVGQLVRFFATKSTFYEPNLSGPVTGPDGIRASAVTTWSEWPRCVFDALSITIEDPRVVIEWRTIAPHKSGLEHLLEGVDILEFAGEQITSCRIYYDTRVQAKPAKKSRPARRK